MRRINVTGNTAKDAALLEVGEGADNQGILIPRVSLTAVGTYSLAGTPVTSLLVYSNTAPSGGSGVGFYYWSIDNKWTALSTGAVTNVSGTYPIVSSGGSTPVVSIEIATTSDAGSMSAADKTKLDGISTGAEVNVNADWNATSGDAQILNKPTIPAASDGSETHITAGTNINVTGTGTTGNPYVINAVNVFVCPSTFTVDHRLGAVAPENKLVKYGTISTTITGTAKCWITQNLGATNQATSATDATDAAAGWYWQFNRKQGYKVSTLYPAWTVTSISETSDWFPGNDPCAIELGAGWRIPTSTEWNSANTNGGPWTGIGGAHPEWAAPLYLHAAGCLGNSSGTLYDRGTYGSYWSSTHSNATSGWYLYFYSGNSLINNVLNKAYGLSLRCLRD
ncbi:MAG: hypothetical protein HGB12_15820 [Bacteroidetes bacterium]|nr:hypothetical protein [Bacteroidota bacterium]